MAEQGAGGGVELDADVVDGALDGGVEGVGEIFLIDVVLVLADADGLRVDFHELGERVLHAAGDGDGTANHDVVFGQFFPGEFRGGVDGGTGFVGDEVVHVRQMVVGDELARELLRLVGGGAVADGEQRDVVLPDGGEHGAGGGFFRAFALGNLQHAVIEDAAGGIHDGHLAAIAVAGVEAHDGLACERGLQQKLAQVGAEDLDGLFLSRLGEAGADFALQRGQQQAFVAVFDGGLQLALPDGGAADDLPRDAADIFLEVEVELHLEAAELLAAVDGEDAVRGQLMHGLAVVSVHLEGLRGLGGGVLDEFRREYGKVPDTAAHILAQLRVLHRRLGDDVAGTGEGVFRRLYALFRIDVFLRFL